MKYQDKLQGKIDAYVLHSKALAPQATVDELAVLTMFNFNIFFDEAQIRVKQALKAIKS